MIFQDRVVASRIATDAPYVFNSHRLTWSLRLGGTVKVRNAQIGLEGTPGRSVQENLGLVPLVSGFARYPASDRVACAGFARDALRGENHE